MATHSIDFIDPGVGLSESAMLLPAKHCLVQAGMLLGGGREGGLFVMIGRKKA